MSKLQNRDTGQIGERIAEEFLEKKGYQILERNWRIKFGELDIIAKFQDTRNKIQTLVFVEVKTKRGEDWGSPEEMVDRRKLEKVRRMATLYRPQVDILRQIDVVAIVLNYDGSVKRIDHYGNVY